MRQLRMIGAFVLALSTCWGELALAISRHRQRNVRGAARLYAERRAEDPMSAYLDDLQATGVKVKSFEDMFDDATAVDTHPVEPLSSNASTGTDYANATAPKPSPPRRHVVIAKYDEDVSWLKKLPENFDVSVYQSKDPSVQHFIENVGNEASKYLSYIVDNYDSLPDTVAFMQAGRMDWHDPIPKDATMRGWDWDSASNRGGIAFLPTAAPCIIEDSDPAPAPASMQSAAAQDPSREQRRQAVLAQEKCVDIVEHSPPQMSTVRSVWGEVFEPELGPLPKHWFTHCCAQFQVTSEAIRQHPLEFYQHLLRWTMEHDKSLLQTDYGEEMKRNHDQARRDAGHVFEVLWVLIFSDPMKRVVLP